MANEEQLAILSQGVMEQVMEYNILDFANWKDDSRFGATFNKLIDGLELFYKNK